MSPVATAAAVPAFARLNPRHFEICMTAARTFVERGYDATSVNDVAAALGVTKAGLYHYIASKEALFIDILNLGMDWLDSEVVKPTQAIADPEERLQTIVLLHAQLIACNEPWISLLLDDTHALQPDARRAIENRKLAYVHLVRDTLIELRDAGRLINVDPTTAAFSVLGMILWLPRWVRPDGRLSGEELAAQVTKIAMQGLLTPKESAGIEPVGPGSAGDADGFPQATALRAVRPRKPKRP
jgi:TetR/AcrR family transcriptional regulator, cholesterol catabolism regulator